MHLNLENSIALIESSDIDRSEFGSGFIIKRDRYATYWLTCAHVVIDVGGIKKTRVGKFSAELAGLSEAELARLRDSYDLAVLRVEGLFWKEPLRLEKPKGKFIDFSVIGHFQNEGTKQKYIKEITGRLRVGDLNLVTDDDYARVLELELRNTDLLLQPGYSGSPVLIQNARQVVGVVDQRKGDGKQGLAISVEAASRIFQKVPELRNVLRDKALLSRIKLADWLMYIIEKPLRWNTSPETREALDWLSGAAIIANQAGDYALKSSTELHKLISNIPDVEQKERLINDFYWEIEKYLERIYASLLTNKYELLNKPSIVPSLSIVAYESAFDFVKQSIPSHIDKEVAETIKERINYLVSNLY